MQVTLLVKHFDNITSIQITYSLDFNYHDTASDYVIELEACRHISINTLSCKVIH